jgi:hypothetical protein
VKDSKATRFASKPNADAASEADGAIAEGAAADATCREVSGAAEVLAEYGGVMGAAERSGAAALLAEEEEAAFRDCLHGGDVVAGTADAAVFADAFCL